MNISPEPKKLEMLNGGGKVIGDFFMYGDGGGVEYTLKLDQLEVDSSVAFNKFDDRLHCSLSRDLFIDENIDGGQAVLKIGVAIKSNYQVFNDVFRSKLFLPE